MIFKAMRMDFLKRMYRIKEERVVLEANIYQERSIRSVNYYFEKSKKDVN